MNRTTPRPVRPEPEQQAAHGKTPSRWRQTLQKAGRSHELPVLAVAVIAYIVAGLLSPYFGNVSDLLSDSPVYAEIGVIALAMTIVIVNGDIDLSVGSQVGLCAAVLAELFEHGLGLGAACAVAIALGAVLGLVNGLIVTRFSIPSLVVTLGTLALYRGLAEVLLGNNAISNFPIGFTNLSSDVVPGTSIPWPLVVVIVFAVAFAALLHRCSFGRYCFFIGSSRDVARYSGVRVDAIRCLSFVLAGLMCGVAAVLITARLGSTQSDVATGYELTVITVVVLGGTDIFGGRGSIGGTLLALLAVVFLEEGMTLANYDGETQAAVVGLLLVVSILGPKLIRVAIARLRGPPGVARPPEKDFRASTDGRVPQEPSQL